MVSIIDEGEALSSDENKSQPNSLKVPDLEIDPIVDVEPTPAQFKEACKATSNELLEVSLCRKMSPIRHL